MGVADGKVAVYQGIPARSAGAVPVERRDGDRHPPRPIAGAARVYHGSRRGSRADSRDEAWHVADRSSRTSASLSESRRAARAVSEVAIRGRPRSAPHRARPVDPGARRSCIGAYALVGLGLKGRSRRDLDRLRARVHRGLRRGVVRRPDGWRRRADPGLYPTAALARRARARDALPAATRRPGRRAGDWLIVAWARSA